jgi:hypothetical protein
MYSKFDERDIGNNELGNHEPPSIQPWLGLIDFHFEPMMVHLGQKFQTDDEPKHSVLIYCIYACIGRTFFA